MRAIEFCIALVFLWSSAVCANIKISNTTIAGDVAALSGENFGHQCPTCEVVADYGGFRYTLPVVSWNANEIKVRLLDLGKGTTVRLEVTGNTGTSNPVTLELATKVIPRSRLRKIVSPEDSRDLQVFTRWHDLSIGGKGVDTFDVSQPQVACGARARVFDSAEIVLGKRTRFGDARKVGSPQSGCTSCAPVKVGYYFEPTGKLEYQLHVYRREIVGICPDMIRQ